MNSKMQIYEESNDASAIYQFSIGLMINTNDLRFVVDEELATINFNI